MLCTSLNSALSMVNLLALIDTSENVRDFPFRNELFQQKIVEGNMRYFLLAFVFVVSCANTIHAQLRFQIPNLDNPNLENSYLFPNSKYKSLQSRFLIKTTKSFELSGQVKDIKEIITYGTDPVKQLREIFYRFSNNGNLISYAEDTLQGFMFSGSTIENYIYDSTGNNLLKSIILNGAYNTEVIKLFDYEGYVTTESYQKFQRKDWSLKDYEIDIFDYILNYEWNGDRDTVYTFYNYKTKYEIYQRHKDGYYSFKHERQNLNRDRDSLLKIVSTYKSDPFIPVGYGVDKQVELDSSGNIIKFYVFDNSIKNSYNVHQLFEYEYDKNNTLVGVKFSTSGPQPEFVPSEEYSIEYLKYDEFGNWIEKRVTGMHYNGDLKYVECNFIYTRTIKYY